MKRLRVMIFNVGYMTGITGRPFEYLTHGYRLLLPDRAEQSHYAHELGALLRAEDPDILFLAEIRDEPWLKSVRAILPHGSVDSKYAPGSFFEHMPFFRGNCNGIFLKDALPFEKVFLDVGAKRLVYRVDVTPDFSIFFGHFALGAATRKRQFAQIAHSAQEKKYAILAGDLNLFGGADELHDVIETAHMSIRNDLTKGTFPTYRPRHAVDVFVASTSIETMEVRVIDKVVLSDHVPVVADITLEI